MFALKLAKCALTIAAAGALLGVAVAVHEPGAQAAPLIPMVGNPGPVDDYAMGDSMNCFIDYKMWIDRAPGQPHRVVAHMQPKDIRPTVPGTPAPATCAATLITYSATDRNPVNIYLNRYDHLYATRTGGVPIQFDMPYQPDASWVNLHTLPVLQFLPYVNFFASPTAGIFPPTTAFALR